MPYPQIHETPPGAHITFPEVDWIPAQSEVLDMRPVAAAEAAEAPQSVTGSVSASLIDADKTSGLLAFLGVAAACLLMALVQAGVVR